MLCCCCSRPTLEGLLVCPLEKQKLRCTALLLLLLVLQLPQFTQQQQHKHQLQHLHACIYCGLLLLPSERICATGSADGSLRLFDLSAAAAAGDGATAAAADGVACALIAELFGASWGHRDWVVSCAFAADGCLLSGGIDGRLCLWPSLNTPSINTPHSELLWDTEQQQQQQQQQEQHVRAPTGSAGGSHWGPTGGPNGGPPRGNVGMSCRSKREKIKAVELPPGHRAGVSEVKVRGPPGAPLGASVGYDGSLRLWGLREKKQIAEMAAVEVAAAKDLAELSPLLQFVWLNAFAAAGSRDGAVSVWDLNAQRTAARISAAHRGAVGDLQLLLPPDAAAAAASITSTSTSSSSSNGFVPLLLSGGRGDGRLCVFDLRCLPSAVCTAQAHRAAINSVLPLRRGGGPLSCAEVITLGADGYCKLWDLRCIDTPAASLHAAKDGFLSGALLDETSGLLIGGAAEGAVYLLDMGPGGPPKGAAAAGGPQGPAAGGAPQRAAAGGPPGPQVCWGYGCDRRGGVHAVKTVEIQQKETHNVCAAVLAGGDDGCLACLRFS